MIESHLSLEKDDFDKYMEQKKYTLALLIAEKHFPDRVYGVADLALEQMLDKKYYLDALTIAAKYFEERGPQIAYNYVERSLQETRKSIFNREESAPLGKYGTLPKDSQKKISRSLGEFDEEIIRQVGDKYGDDGIIYCLDATRTGHINISEKMEQIKTLKEEKNKDKDLFFMKVDLAAYITNEEYEKASDLSDKIREIDPSSMENFDVSRYTPE